MSAEPPPLHSADPRLQHRHTTPTSSLNLRMTRLWWVSSATKMRQTTGARWAAWPGGAVTTISLNVEKTKEIVGDFRECTLCMLLWPSMVRPWREWSSTKFLGVHITEDLSWTTTLQHWPRKHNSVSTSSVNSEEPEPRPPSCCTFYRGTIESILTSCITVWYGACNVSCRKSLQRIVRAAEKIVGVSLPSLQDIYSTCLTRKALCIAGDPTHPTHNFFSLLPSGRRLRSLQARTNRLKDSFIHQAVRKLNSLPSLTPRTTELWVRVRVRARVRVNPNPDHMDSFILWCSLFLFFVRKRGIFPLWKKKSTKACKTANNLP